MPNQAGRSGSFLEYKKETCFYPDANGNMSARSCKTGRFGADISEKKFTDKSSVAHTFNLGVGEYTLGKGKIELSNTGVTMSADLLPPNRIFDIKKPLTELTSENGYDAKIIGALQETLQKSRLNIDLNRIVLERIEVEGPGMGVGATFSNEAIGARASAQMSALKIVLSTPIGEISGKLKMGVNVGTEVGFAQTKAGKAGVKQSHKLALGNWELMLTPAQQAKQAPALHEWQQPGAHLLDPSLSLPDIFSTRISSTNPPLFDINTLANSSTSPQLAETLAPSVPVEWTPSSHANRTPQGIPSVVEEASPATDLAAISPGASAAEAKKTLQDNLQRLDLNPQQMATDLDPLNSSDIQQANQQLLDLTSAQAQMIQAFQAQVDTQQQEAAIRRTSQGAQGLIRFGRHINCPGLITVGYVTEFTVEVLEAIKAFQNIQEDTEAFFKILAPLAALGPLGAIGIALGAVACLMDLFGTPGPDPTTLILSRLDTVLEKQQAMMDMLGTIREEQAATLRTIKKEIQQLKAHLSDRLSAERITLAETLTRLEEGMALLSRLIPVAARNQYLQPFHHICTHASQLPLKAGRDADTIKDALETTLLNDATNDLLTGYLEWQAQPPPTQYLATLTTLSATNLSPEAKDSHLNSVLGYIYHSPMINPLLWRQAVDQYIQHTKRFFARYMEEDDTALQSAIVLGESYKAAWAAHYSETTLQAFIDRYYDALTTIKNAQATMIQQFNAVRQAHYNTSYLASGLGVKAPDTLDLMQTSNTIRELFGHVDPEYQSHTYSIQHLHPDVLGKAPNTLKVSLQPYSGKTDALEDRSFDIALSSLSEKFKNKSACDTTVRHHLEWLLCAEYFGLLSFSAEAAPVQYPVIPTQRGRHEIHAATIVDNSSKGSPARYFLEKDDAPWIVQINIHTDNRACELIFSDEPLTDDAAFALLTNTESAYILCKSNDKLFYYSVPSRISQPLYEVPAAFITQLRQQTLPDAKRRLLQGSEISRLRTHLNITGAIQATFSGTYQAFDTLVQGIKTCDGGYQESDTDSFHTILRKAIPVFLQEQCHTSPLTLTLATEEAVFFQTQIDKTLLAERQLLLQCLLENHAEQASLNRCIKAYHEALDALDSVCRHFEIYLYLDGKQLKTPLIDSEALLSAWKTNIAALDKSDLTPELTTACAVPREKQHSLHETVAIDTLSKYHPKRLLHSSITLLQTHQQWRHWMRRSCPWYAYVDVHHYWMVRQFSQMERISEQLHQYFQELKQDVTGFSNAKARLKFAGSTPITNAQTYQDVYTALHDWVLVHAISANVTARAFSIDDVALQRGWAANIGFLLHHATTHLTNPVQIDTIPNPLLWWDGVYHFCLLLNDRDGPYKNGPSLAQSAGLLPQHQIQGIESMQRMGQDLQKAIATVAFSDRLFMHLFDEHLALLKRLRDMTTLQPGTPDQEIIQAWLSHHISQESPLAGSFVTIKHNLNHSALLLKNYLAMAFNEQFAPIIEQALLDGDMIEATLKRLATPLLATLDQWIAKAAYFKKAVLETIGLNRSLLYFSHQLAHYSQKDNLQHSDTLYVTPDCFRPENQTSTQVPLTEAHVDLIDQFLQQSPQIKALHLSSIALEEPILVVLVNTIKTNHPCITRLTLAGANIDSRTAHLLLPLLPQLSHLDLRGNLLGSEDTSLRSLRFRHLIPFIKDCYLHLTYMGLANNQLSMADLNAIQGLLANQPETTAPTFTLDITKNPHHAPLETFRKIKIIQNEEKTKQYVVPQSTIEPSRPLSFAPMYEAFGHSFIQEALLLLLETRQVITRERLPSILNAPQALFTEATNTPLPPSPRKTL